MKNFKIVLGKQCAILNLFSFTRIFFTFSHFKQFNFFYLDCTLKTKKMAIETFYLFQYLFSYTSKMFKNF